MTERVYQFSDVLDMDDFFWLELNNIHIDSYHDPARTLEYQGKSYHYTGRTYTRFITKDEKSDMMLRLKFSDAIILIETRI